MMMARKRPPLTPEQKAALEDEIDAQGYVPRRKEDLSRWWRMFGNLQKYAAAYGIMAAIFIALGFTVVTPKRTRDELADRINATVTESQRLQREIDTLNANRVRLQSQHGELEEQLGVLIRMACQDRFMSRDQKLLIGLLNSHGDCIR